MYQNMAPGEPDVEYRVMLSKLDSILREDDMIRLKSFCKDYIPARKRDALSQGVTLFEALEERNKLSQDNLNFLKEALGSCCAGRSDVTDLVKRYEEKHASFLNNDEIKSGKQKHYKSNQILGFYPFEFFL